MTDLVPPVRLEPNFVTSAPYGDCGLHVVGFVFSDKASGIAAMKAVAELYNSTAALVHGGRVSEEKAE